MGRKRLPPAEKLRSLPTRYRPDRRIASWNIDWRTPVGIRVMGELLTLAQDLGGWDSLSRQKQILVERCTFLLLRTIEYEEAAMQGKPVPFDHGTYSNHCNVLLGHLRQLGIERQARPVSGLQQYLAAQSKAAA